MARWILKLSLLLAFSAQAIEPTYVSVEDETDTSRLWRCDFDPSTVDTEQMPVDLHRLYLTLAPHLPAVQIFRADGRRLTPLMSIKNVKRYKDGARTFLFAVTYVLGDSEKSIVFNVGLDVDAKTTMLVSIVPDDNRFAQYRCRAP